MPEPYVPPASPHAAPPIAPPGPPAHPNPSPVAYGSVPPEVPGEPPRRSRAWMWWTLGVLALIAVMVVSCTLPFYALFSGGDGSQGAFGDAVAVIRIDGVIAGTGDSYSGFVTPDAFNEKLERAADDDAVKAIVLRVDSPGGTVAASEEISSYVKDAKKPVVVSIGDIGASGAYMISSQADEIWAMPGSSVGSIGVITEIPNASELLNKVGVEFQVITAGKNKDTGSVYRPLTKEERSLIQGEVDEAYEQFISIVASGRKMDDAEVRELATGWAWSGERALKMKLIDRIGTYQDALDSAAKRGGIKGDDYEVITYDDEFGELFGSLLGASEALRRLAPLDVSREAAVRQAIPR